MKVAVIGHGIVGSGVAEILLEREKEISRAAGKSVALGYVLDIKDLSALPYSEKATDDFGKILADPEVGIIAESIGGIEPAYSYIKAALESGRSAVTSNKELIAEKGAELLSIARKNGVNLLFEASVGGGIPLIRPLYSAMNTAGITGFAGILNGTTNYILTQMFRFGADYETALSGARRLGYAEADPSADVLGIDACRKAAILASLIWGKTLRPEEIPTEGITSVSAKDVSAADENGFSIKLLARGKRLDDGKIFAKVSPALIPKDSPLASVGDVFNAVLVRAETTGEVLFYGKGAGKMPTASAVISDIIECARAKENISAVFWEDGAQSISGGKDSVGERQFLRISGLSPEDISVLIPGSEMLVSPSLSSGEHAVLTPKMTESEFSVLGDKINEHGVLLSRIPLFE